MSNDNKFYNPDLDRWFDSMYEMHKAVVNDIQWPSAEEERELIRGANISAGKKGQAPSKKTIEASIDKDVLIRRGQTRKDRIEAGIIQTPPMSDKAKEKSANTREKNKADANKNNSLYAGEKNRGRKFNDNVIQQRQKTKLQKKTECREQGIAYGDDKKKGKPLSPERVAKRELTRAQRQAAAEALGESYGFNSPKAITKRVETRRRNREAKLAQGIPNPLKGKPQSEETREKKRQAWIRRKAAKLAAQALTQTE